MNKVVLIGRLTKDPELKGTKRVREGRKAKETEYREYARGSV